MARDSAVSELEHGLLETFTSEIQHRAGGLQESSNNGQEDVWTGAEQRYVDGIGWTVGTVSGSISVD